MLLAPSRPRVNTGQQGVSRPQPPPTGGWNARDSLDAMAPEDAVILENFFPQQSDVVTRLGTDLHCNTGEGSFSVETLAEWKAGSSRKLVAGCHGKLINVTTSTPSTLGSGFSSNRWRWVAFAERLFFVNGVDSPKDYDGTTLSTTAWVGSGLTNTNLCDVCVFKERLFFAEKNTLNFWYADLKAITSTLTKFELKYTGNYGGTLIGIATLSVDGGAGPDDLILFYLSSGEVIVYQGSDPSDANDWALVNRYHIAPLITQGGLVQFGSDVVAITKGAYTPITKVAAFGSTKPSQLDLSDKISGAVASAAKSYGDNTGWQGVLYPKGRKLVINVPLSATRYNQHVMNLDTKAWCKFTGWNFPVFGLYNDNLYAGSTDGKVYQVDTGYSDNDAAIVSDMQTAWNYFGDARREKNFTMARIIFAAVSDPMAAMSIGTDFEISVPTSTVSTADIDSGAIWDDGIWDDAIWSGATQAIRGWQGLAGMGYCASMRLRMSLTEQQVALRSANIIFKPAGMV